MSRKWIAKTLSLAVLFSPILALAAGIPTIVSCSDPGQMCGICDIAKTAQNILNAGIYISIFFSAGAFAYAGWLHVIAGGEPGKVSEARSIFWHVGVGLVLILAAWLIVDTIMKVLYDPGVVNFGPWNEVC